MNVLLPTDVFPPKSGGAGWSSHALALALIERGHRVQAIVPQAGARGVTQTDVLGVPVVRLGYRAPNIPFVKNYVRHERLWGRLASVIVEAAVTSPASHSIIHAQHVQVAPAAVLAGKRLDVPVVVTVRDHWPWDYFATGLHGNRVPYSRQGPASLATDLVVRQGPLQGTLAMLAIPYILAHVRRRQAFLRQADAVIAVSNYIAERLRAIVPAERIHVVPNMLDINAINRVIVEPPQTTELPYLLFVGKLDRNKGADLLLHVFRAFVAGGGHARDLPPLVFAGNGPLRPLLERELTMLGVRTQFLEWADHDEVLRLMAHCEVLLFPSAWGEPLSRVWLEAVACGAPILTMPTGGVHDVLRDHVNGALEPTPELFASRLRALLADAPTRRRYGAAAQATARAKFASTHVIAQVEALYSNLADGGGGVRG